MTSINQQINLYLPELRPRRDLVTASRTVLVLSVLLGLALLMSIVQWWQTTLDQNRLVDVEQALQEQTARTERLENEVAARATDQALVREMDTRELRVQQARELYDFMQGTTLGNLVGYSQHLKDLSRASFTGLWLQEIRIVGNADRVMIRGVAQEPAMLPDFVGRLSGGNSAISTRRFNRLVSARDANQQSLYEFTLEAGE
ncbi:PilN domain-containing protein [Pseudohongiella sp. SYSU M77423]|uniref:PilN domain-containing protein n=1 Tax=Pseudohongiella sp. SYSU M77423 TaxID=3042312 RepID=UPI0024813ECA|nr:PilN domain-containing protein [Pseudohongiella sp. SYSU M77423]MDH7942700.1 PilN domain-containing protein [Pseudohongiella sp. SYSU M77423]